ncbi:hypothetical protein L3Q82_002616 [Scortum barcoo]|uniref:Uncharacterized protein n=1 Tax=Scortum barcoo TaxID=214431 RepID=A0ACB8VUK8_9TELE|nr:hypothetical protein L3Q82_002616 [Scortum barcoo]
MDADQMSALCGRQIEAKICRRLHQSSLKFGDTPTCCSTTNSDRINLKVENWTRHHGGRAVREIINPQQPSEKQTTHRSELRAPQAGGRPRHDVLTGG